MTFLAGTAHLDITPPLGTPMEGYWHLRRATGLLDPLYLRALVLSDGDSMAAIVTADLCLLPRELLDKGAQTVQEQSGIPRDGLFVTCSHTHTGPATGRLFTRHAPLPWYQDLLRQRLADVVELARQALTPARVAVGESKAEGLAFNRRLLGPDGQVHTFKPNTHAQSTQPAGPVDQQVRVLYVASDSGRPLAALVNFGLHPDTTGGAEISADYPGILASTLSRMLGHSPNILFLNGTCGDINHLDPQHPREPYARENALRIGQHLAADAYKATRDLTWLEVGSLKAAREPVTLRVRSPEPAQLEAARKIVETHTGEPTRPLVRAKGLLQVAQRSGEPFTTEVSAISLGDAVFVGLPGEVFIAWGLQIRAASPFPHTFIAELTNDYAGYIPTAEAFAQGGYETELCQGSFAEESAGQELVDATGRLLSRLWQR